MELAKKLLIGGILSTSLILTSSCGTGDKKWARYIEDQLPCELTIQKGDSYWKIAKKLKKDTPFETYYTGWIGQKLENYRENPKNNHLKPNTIIEVPCGIAEQ